MQEIIKSNEYYMEAVNALAELDNSFFYEEVDSVSLISKAGSALKNVYDGMIAAIKKFIDAIRETIGRIFMSAESKAKFKEYEDYLKNNPETANQKATVLDFKKIDDAYMMAIMKANKLRKENANKSEAEKIMTELNGVLKVAGIGITVGAAFKMLASNKKVAEATLNLMNKFNGDLENTKKIIGEDNYNKGKETLEKETNRTFWDKTIFGLLSKKKQHNDTTMKSLFGIIKSAIPGTNANKDPHKSSNNMKNVANIVENHPKVAAAAMRVAAAGKSVKEGLQRK